MQPAKINTVYYKRKFLNVSDTFLTENVAEKKDINYYIQVPVNHCLSLQEFHTLLIDLSSTKEEIWSRIYHRTQTEITSFQNNNKFEHKVFNPVPQKNFAEHLQLLEKFTSIRKIRKPEKERLLAYNKEGILLISSIMSDTEIHCVNFYRVTEQRAVNLHSFTTQELKTNDHSSSFFGKAHRTLHWLDMLYFKENGIAKYDFGGWYDGNKDESLLHINQFKEQFGGEKIKEYSGAIYHHPLLKLIKKILK